jgi:hypothetical protein
MEFPLYLFLVSFCLIIFNSRKNKQFTLGNVSSLVLLFWYSSLLKTSLFSIKINFWKLGCFKLLQFCNKHYKMKFIYRLFSSTIKVYVLFNLIYKILFIVFGGNLQISFIKVFLKSFFECKKKMFAQYTNQLLSIILCSTLVIFLSISNFVWRAFIEKKQPSIE